MTKTGNEMYLFPNKDLNDPQVSKKNYFDSLFSLEKDRYTKKLSTVK